MVSRLFFGGLLYIVPCLDAVNLPLFFWTINILIGLFVFPRPLGQGEQVDKDVIETWLLHGIHATSVCEETIEQLRSCVATWLCCAK